MCSARASGGGEADGIPRARALLPEHGVPQQQGRRRGDLAPAGDPHLMIPIGSPSIVRQNGDDAF
jgi:hypothetical protein